MSPAAQVAKGEYVPDTSLGSTVEDMLERYAEAIDAFTTVSMSVKVTSGIKGHAARR